MAKNILGPFDRPEATFTGAASDPATPKSGDPVRFGALCGVALIDEAADGNVVACTHKTRVQVTAKGIDGGGNSAIALYDKLYYVDADTPKISKKNTGTYFGMALSTLGAGSTGTVTVLLNA